MVERCMALEVNREAFDRQQQAIAALMTTDPEMQKNLRQTIYEELKAARDRVVNDIRFSNGDPRGTAHAVKRYVAAKYLGGVISILNGKKGSGGRNTYEAPRKLIAGQRGGNRMLRSTRTDDILHYAPSDRGFILRMVNSGTRPRYANGRNGSWDRRGNNKTFFELQAEGSYYRGSIASRNFFGQAAGREMQVAVERLQEIIETELNKLMGNG